MSAEQELREAVDEYRNCGSTYEGISWSATELLGDAVGRLLDPIPDEVIAGLIWELGGVDAIVAERAIGRYRAWLIGGDA